MLREVAGPVLDVKRHALGGLAEHARMPLYRNAYALILSDTSNSALGIVYWTLAARVYTTEQVGLNSAAISTMVFLAGIAQLSARTSIPLARALAPFIPRIVRGIDC